MLVLLRMRYIFLLIIIFSKISFINSAYADVTKDSPKSNYYLEAIKNFITGGKSDLKKQKECFYKNSTDNHVAIWKDYVANHENIADDAYDAFLFSVNEIIFYNCKELFDFSKLKNEEDFNVCTGKTTSYEVPICVDEDDKFFQVFLRDIKNKDVALIVKEY